jgi:Co/Zn/Cd efflux system component
VRALRRSLVLLVVYLALEVAFWLLTRSRGLLSPGGAPHLDVLGLGVLFLLARLAVRFTVPALIAYGVVTAGAREAR